MAHDPSEHAWRCRRPTLGIVAAYLVPQVTTYAGVAGLPPGTGSLAVLPTLGPYEAQARINPGPLVHRYDSPLFFANAQGLHRRAADAVDEVRRELTGRGIAFAFAQFFTGVRTAGRSGRRAVPSVLGVPGLPIPDLRRAARRCSDRRYRPSSTALSTKVTAMAIARRTANCRQ